MLSEDFDIYLTGYVLFHANLKLFFGVELALWSVLMKKKRLRVFFDRGPMAASISVTFGGIVRGDKCIRLQYLLVDTAWIRNISGWSIREVHVPHSVYDALLKTMKLVDLSIGASEIAVHSSDDGSKIVFHVCFFQPSLLRGINRRFGVYKTKQTVFFPFKESC